jgi:hypothetical protein
MAYHLITIQIQESKVTAIKKYIAISHREAKAK